ncbi:hypothetical protein [Pilimelia columellifera]|uniref:Uncharacterized protein n=1 Tax=Pilimelia columellifera subsp. columellifera TaxID=706583 RepID=A0ABP6AWR7_9ACTN
MEILTARGRMARLVAAALTFGLLLAGTVWGDDDHFPFGPFRMYATNGGPNTPASDTLIEAVDVNGRTLTLNERNSGVRRAEVEGQLSRYAEDPARLGRLAEAYLATNPGAARLAQVRIVIRWHGIRDSRPTGTHTDELVAQWRLP